MEGPEVEGEGPGEAPSRPHVLAYRGPEVQPAARNAAIRHGVISAWLMVFMSLLFFPVAVLIFPIALAAMIVKGVRDLRHEGHAGFLLGVALGILTSVGLGMLLFAVICGR